MPKNGKGAGPETGSPGDCLAGGRRGSFTQNPRRGQSQPSRQPMPSHEAAVGLLEAMRAAGIDPSEPGAVLADLLAGGLVRFRCEGDGRGKRNGFARLFCDGRPAGFYGHWRLGIERTWSANHRLVKASPADMAAIEARKAQEREAREAGYRAAESEARRLWQAAGAPRADHAYLASKRLGSALAGLDPHAPQIVVRQSGPELLIALHTMATACCNLQKIYPDGSKRFLPGGRLEGAFWYSGPRAGGPIIAIGEGFATMAAVRLATGLPVVAAMTAGNLEAVALAFHARFPAARLILCADMDVSRMAGNIGLAKANAAAAAVPGALVARPPMPPGWPEGRGWDFADTFKAPGGLVMIRRALGLEKQAHG